MQVAPKPRLIAIITIICAVALSTLQNVSVAQATTLTCAQGGVCVVGDTGPGGGIVFYVDQSGDGFNCGPTGDNMCMYLENGRGVGASGIALWSNASLQSTAVPYPGAAGVSVGTGYQNTLAIIDQQGPYDAVTNKYMAGATQAFRGGGKTDWYLPSTDELYELHLSRLGTTSFTQSSTETSPTTISGIYFPVSSSVIIPNVGKSEATNYFTSIRAFSSVPDAPVISTLVGSDRQLRITFTIASDGGEAIDLIQYSSDSGATWVGASGTTSPITISSLTGRTSYTVQIRAHNSVGNSSGSNLKTAATTDSSVDASEAAAAAAEAARVAALNASLAADAAKRAWDQKQMSELLSVIPSIAGLALNLGDLTNSLLVKQKCVKGKTIKYVKKGAKCAKGYVKRK